MFKGVNMKLIALLDHKIEPLIANVFKTKQNRLYYSLKLGDYNVKNVSKTYHFTIDAKMAKPTSETDTLRLDGNNYEITPIKSHGEKLVNGRGEQVYNITSTRNSIMDKDLLVCWFIPAKRCIPGSTIYTIEGDVTQISEAVNAKERDGVIFATPIPIIEIYGNCVLNWSSVNVDGRKLGQKIVYDIQQDKFLFEYTNSHL